MEFNVGDKVVCLTDHMLTEGMRLVKGDYYIIKGVKLCKCGTLDVDVGFRSSLISRLSCECGYVEFSHTCWIKATRFTKLGEDTESESISDFMKIFNKVKI